MLLESVTYSANYEEPRTRELKFTFNSSFDIIKNSDLLASFSTPKLLSPLQTDQSSFPWGVWACVKAQIGPGAEVHVNPAAAHLQCERKRPPANQRKQEVTQR